MSYSPNLTPEKFEELFRIFSAAFHHVGITPKEARSCQIRLKEELKSIWQSLDPPARAAEREGSLV